MDDRSGASRPTEWVKSIILFSDGTGNSSGKLFKTNVFRLYEAVDLGPAQTGQQRQIAYYDDGVGTSALKPLRMVQGIFGIGLKRNVLEIYGYACRNYNPNSIPLPKSSIREPGDHIYGFGFSRGAFTMRLVISLIADQGLIPYKDERDLDWEVEQAWKAFRRRWPRSIDRLLKWIDRLRKWSRLHRPPLRPERKKDASAAADSGRPAVAKDPAAGTAEPSPDSPKKDAGAAPRRYDPSKNYHPVIRLIGVWDTVAAYGGPVTEITRAIDNFLYRLSLPNYELDPPVRCARHALALDEERDSFQPLLWDELAEKRIRSQDKDKTLPWLHSDRLQQVWFVGVHSDVGGGYPDESLSYVSLLWMMEEAHKCDLRTVDYVTERYQGLANSYGPIHNSRAGLGAYYRYQPRRISAWMDPADERTLGLRDPAIRGPHGPKGLIEQPLIHASVIARIASGTDGYAPIVLPDTYKIVPEGVRGETRFLKTTGGIRLTAQETKAAKLNPPPVLPPRVLRWLTDPVKAGIANAMESAWDRVWLRRVTYFATMIATVLILAMPWWVPPEIARSQTDKLGFLDLPIVSALWEAVANLVRMVGGLLPEFLQRWITAWSGHPIWFSFFFLAILVLMGISTRIERAIADHARSVWHSAVPRIPPASVETEAAELKPDTTRRWRNTYGYQRTIQLFKWLFLPNFVFGPLMVGVILWFVHALGIQLFLPFLEGRFDCRTGRSTVQITQAESGFRTDSFCNPVVGKVEAGERYSVDFEITEDWQDADYPATPEGIGAGDMRWGIGYLGAPFRRAIGSAYLQPVAAVRTRGGGAFRFVQLRPLEMKPVADAPNRFQAEFEAPETGELYLFVNDAVLPYDLDMLYENNKGAARVTVTSAAHSAALAAAEAAAAAAPVGLPPPNASPPPGAQAPAATAR